MQAPVPQQEHQWLQQLVGEWTYENEAVMAPGQPPTVFRGTEKVRSLGGLWVLCEGSGDMGGGTATTLMTLGYDPARKCFVGTFIASMMSHLWIYENGALDAAGKALSLNAEGPGMSPEGKMAKYIDTIEFISPDERTLSSKILGEDGKWTQFMTAKYRRKSG